MKELCCAPIKCSATHCAVHITWIIALSLHRYFGEVSVHTLFSYKVKYLANGHVFEEARLRPKFITFLYDTASFWVDGPFEEN